VPEGEEVRPAFGADGLVTAIAQDATSGEVLMVAHMDEAAWEATLRDGYATFWSRSRGRLWRKGETSGNTLRVRSIRLDCDGDAVLLGVDAAGPACHTGERSCFFTDVPMAPGGELGG
jgi:phosphoribosyl-AMP cyclohydrolase